MLFFSNNTSVVVVSCAREKCHHYSGNYIAVRLFVSICCAYVQSRPVFVPSLLI